MKTYTPTPMDTTKIALPEEFTPLLESLAKQVYKQWAAGSMPTLKFITAQGFETTK